ncbi:hypothetical protein KY290_010820 [Solanum tuberosum]|uniref:Glycosyltransferase family 92 protein n=1 Tax=Solanum tuberosum TaxID=4113 RepID=A0ABQ7W0V5_SOLTU|nr:hypothetical protein KY290_010820 [Solanum tuberosum]
MWLAGFFYQPFNHELFVKHTLNMEIAIIMAREAGVDWIIHLDTDELMHPAGLVSILYGDLWQIYLKMLTWSYFLTIQNFFEKVCVVFSMLKKNYDHLTKEMYFGNYNEATRGNPNYFLTYGNGKSAARVQDHLRPS